MSSILFYPGPSVATSGSEFTGPFIPSNGSAAAPAYAFSAHTDSGMYYDTVNSGVAFSVGGVEKGYFNATGLFVLGAFNSTGVASFPAGTVAAPGANWGTADTGIYAPAAHQLAFATSGVRALLLDANQGATFAAQIVGIPGTATVPSFTYGGNNGLYFPSSSSVAITTAGVQALLLDASQNATFAAGLTATGGTAAFGAVTGTTGAFTGALSGTTGTFTGVVTAPVGAVGAPSFTFTGHATHGLYYDTTNNGTAISVAGAQVLLVDAAGLDITGDGAFSSVLGTTAAGTAGAPSLFVSTVTNGFFAPTANQIAVSTNGTQAALWDASQNMTPAGVILGGAGSVSAPIYAVRAANNGLYSPAANQAAVATNGIQAMLWDGSQNTTIPTSAKFLWSGRTQLASPTDGQIRLFNSADGATPNVGSVGLILGPASTSGVYLTNRNTNGRLGIRLGDDSDYAAVASGGFLVLSNQSSALTDGNVTGVSLLSGNAGFFANGAINFLAGNAGQIDNAAVNIKTVRATTTLSTVSATTPLVTIPAGAMVLMVTARVTTAITSTTSTSWSLGTGAIANDWGSGLAFAQNTTVNGTNYVGFTAPQMYPAATAINAVLNVTAATAGAIKVVVYYIDVTVPANNN